MATLEIGLISADSSPVVALTSKLRGEARAAWSSTRALELLGEELRKEKAKQKPQIHLLCCWCVC